MRDDKGRPLLGAPRRLRAYAVAKGNERAGKRRILCTFDAMCFEEVRDAALAENCSFAQVVRQAVESWLEERQHG